MARKEETHIFDDVFRTMEEVTPELMIPLINEVFKTNYTKNAVITRLGDKHHLLQQLLETDSCVGIEDKVYHFECESKPNSGIVAIRMFQYDVTVALEQKRKERGVYVVEFPSSCVIYLRHNAKIKNQEKLIVRMPDGREIEYCIPVIKSQEYTKEEIFEKKLYILLPYYIMRYEKQLKQIEQEEEKRQKLLEEYKVICQQLGNTLGAESPLVYSELHKLMGRVLEYILSKQDLTKKGVREIMGGQVLESFAQQMKRETIENMIRKKIAKNKTLEEIVEEVEEDISYVEPLYKKILKESKKKKTQ